MVDSGFFEKGGVRLWDLVRFEHVHSVYFIIIIVIIMIIMEIIDQNLDGSDTFVLGQCLKLAFAQLPSADRLCNRRPHMPTVLDQPVSQ